MAHIAMLGVMQLYRSNGKEKRKRTLPHISMLQQGISPLNSTFLLIFYNWGLVTSLKRKEGPCRCRMR